MKTPSDSQRQCPMNSSCLLNNFPFSLQSSFMYRVSHIQHCWLLWPRWLFVVLPMHIWYYQHPWSLFTKSTIPPSTPLQLWSPKMPPDIIVMSINMTSFWEPLILSLLSVSYECDDGIRLPVYVEGNFRALKLFMQCLLASDSWSQHLNAMGLLNLIPTPLSELHDPRLYQGQHTYSRQSSRHSTKC